MKHVFRGFAVTLIALALVIALPLIAQAIQAEKPAAGKNAVGDVSKLAWLAGVWVSEDDKGRSEEHWMEPRGGSMIGMNRTLRKAPADAGAAAGSERTAFFEYLQIVANDHGVAYLASPRGRFPPTVFPMIECEGARVVFENPKHDFPQKITYRRDGDTMHARVEGTQDGKESYEEWAWKLAAK